MNKCNRCGENNPAEVHTCTPGYHFSEHEKLKEIIGKKYDIKENGDIISYCKHTEGYKLKPIKLNTGYSKVRIGNKYYLVHRLIAFKYLGLDINNRKIVVCHKDDNPLNNNVENLFLGTQKDNLEDMSKKGRATKHLLGKLGGKNHNSKKVNQYDLNGKFIKTWDSIMDTERYLGIANSSISQVINGKRKTAGGFVFRKS